MSGDTILLSMECDSHFTKYRDTHKGKYKVLCDDINNMKCPQLRELCKSKNIDNYRKMKKSQMLENLMKYYDREVTIFYYVADFNVDILEKGQYDKRFNYKIKLRIPPKITIIIISRYDKKVILTYSCESYSIIRGVFEYIRDSTSIDKKSTLSYHVYIHLFNRDMSQFDINRSEPNIMFIIDGCTGAVWASALLKN